jgi:phosphatidylinositol-3-phosphatase
MTFPNAVPARMRRALLALLTGLAGIASAHAATMPTPPVRHVFVIVLENEMYDITFGEQSLAPYLAKELPGQGALLKEYYGIGHNSLDNYLAMISGQAPNPETQDDCHVFSEFTMSQAKLDDNGQALGQGCVYPKIVKTLPDQLEAAGFSWKGYMEDMGKDPTRESATCGHAVIGTPDATGHATPGDQYAAKHNPFVYFHSIIDDKDRCGKHVVNLAALEQDLKKVQTTPNYAFITPNLCNDGHDAPCKDGGKGGLISADEFLRLWVPRITASPAFKKDGLLIITFDEGLDSVSCCGEVGLPGSPLTPGGKVPGAGGGKTGTVLLSPFIKPGTVSTTPYNHYSMLRSVEGFFKLGYLGYSAIPSLQPFGNDVFNQH